MSASKIILVTFFFASISNAAVVRYPVKCLDKNPNSQQPLVLKLVEERQQPALWVGNKIENWQFATGVQFEDMLGWWKLDLNLEQADGNLQLTSSADKSEWAKVKFTINMITGEGTYSGTAVEPNPTETNYGAGYIENYPVQCTFGAEQ